MLLTATLALASPWPDLVPPPRVGGGEQDAALVVAVDDYFAVPDVPGAEANGAAWYDWFVDGRSLPASSVRWLRGTEATAEAIRAAAAEVGQLAGPEGHVWLVFVGHGAATPDGDPLVLGVDVQGTVASVVARGVRRSELTDALAAGGAQPVLVLDSCFSGLTPEGAPLLPGVQPVLPAWVEDGADGPTVLTAATGAQFAGALPAAERPAFSYLLLGALQGWGDADHDGTVTASEAVAYTHRALKTTVTDRDQQPAHFGPDRPLAAASAIAAPDLAAVVRDRRSPAREAPPPLAPLPAPIDLSQVDDLRIEAQLAQGYADEADPRKTPQQIRDSWCDAARWMEDGPYREEFQGRCDAWKDRIRATASRRYALQKAYDAVRTYVAADGIDHERKAGVAADFVRTWTPLQGEEAWVVRRVARTERRLRAGHRARLPAIELPEAYEVERDGRGPWYWNNAHAVVNHMVVPISVGLAGDTDGNLGIDGQLLTQMTISWLEVSLLRTTAFPDTGPLVYGAAAGVAPFTHRPSRRERGELRGSMINPVVGAAYRGGRQTDGSDAGVGWLEAYAANQLFVTNHLGLRLEARLPFVSTARDTPTSALRPMWVVAPVFNVAGGA